MENIREYEKICGKYEETWRKYEGIPNYDEICMWKIMKKCVDCIKKNMEKYVENVYEGI